MNIQSSPKIESQLAPECEGKVFEHIWIDKANKTWRVHKDFYAVQNGQVYIIGTNQQMQLSGDTLLSLTMECAEIERYDPGKTYLRTSKVFSREELITALGMQ